MRRSCERLENNYSDLPVQCLNDLVSPCAGLGWAGLAGLGWAGWAGWAGLGWAGWAGVKCK